MALLEDGTVYSWGGTLHKKLGQRKEGSSVSPVTDLLGRNIIYIDCGDFHSLALEDDGTLYSWGGGGVSYNKGQCGHGHNKDCETPQRMKFFNSKPVSKIAAGGYHSLALTSNFNYFKALDDGELYAWGAGIYGECGYGEFNDTNKPKLVNLPFITGKDVSNIN
jgi:alpha-tubulin suppressor-like RCC1 family protein